MMERTELICYMLGWIEGVKQPIKRCDSLILLDQILFKMNQPRVTEKEKESFQNLGDEMGFGLIQMGIGRDRAKQIAKDGYI